MSRKRGEKTNRASFWDQRRHEQNGGKRKTQIFMNVQEFEGLSDQACSPLLMSISNHNSAGITLIMIGGKYRDGA